jgi:hypothetical protein
VWLALDQGNASVQDHVLLQQMIVELRNVSKDRLRVFIGLPSPLVGGPTQDLLADQDHEDQQELDDIAHKQQEREWIRVDIAQRPESGQPHPDEHENDREVDDPHGTRAPGERGGESAIKTDVLVRGPGRPQPLTGRDWLGAVGSGWKVGHGRRWCLLSDAGASSCWCMSQDGSRRFEIETGRREMGRCVQGARWRPGSRLKAPVLSLLIGIASVSTIQAAVRAEHTVQQRRCHGLHARRR